jgi:hypothetical protein
MNSVSYQKGKLKESGKVNPLLQGLRAVKEEMEHSSIS